MSVRRAQLGTQDFCMGAYDVQLIYSQFSDSDERSCSWDKSFDRHTIPELPPDVGFYPNKARKLGAKTMISRGAGKRNRSTAQRIASFFKHPLGAAMITFLFTGVAATLFSNFLNGISKQRDLDFAARQRAADSVKTITDLIFERGFRAQMIVSSIKRNADEDEIKQRKKDYDAIFVRYNSTIQSNLFRVREMFHTTEYTDFERLFEGPLRRLLVAQDRCTTSAYDYAISIDESKRASTQDILSHCLESNQEADITSMWESIQQCEYAFTNALFRIVEQSEKLINLSSLESEVQAACQFPKTAGR